MVSECGGVHDALRSAIGKSDAVVLMSEPIFVPASVLLLSFSIVLLQQQGVNEKDHSDPLLIQSDPQSIGDLRPKPNLDKQISEIPYSTAEIEEGRQNQEKNCDSIRTLLLIVQPITGILIKILRSEGDATSDVVWKGDQIAFSILFLENEITIAPYDCFKKISVDDEIFKVPIDEMSNEMTCDNVKIEEVPEIQSICELETFSSAHEVFDEMSEKHLNKDDVYKGSDCDFLSEKSEMSLNFDLFVEVLLVYISMNEEQVDYASYSLTSSVDKKLNDSGVLAVFDPGGCGLSDLLKF